VVIGVNSLEDQEQLGRHGDTATGNPRGKIAWKFAEERALPVLKGKEWNTGRTGAVKPVGLFDAVSLAGTQVSRATLHNVGFIFRNQIKVGTTIQVLKAGKIIPKVVGVVANAANYKKIEDVDYPVNCPSCGCKTVVEQSKSGGEDMYELVCPNKDACPAQNITGLLHYLKTLGVLGLGEATVTALVEGGCVKVPADFYELTAKDICECGLSLRQARLAMAAIHMVPAPEKLDDDDLKEEVWKAMTTTVKTVPLWKLFASFGIESAGKSAGKALVDHFHTFDAIRAASVAQLEAVGDVGAKTAQIVYDYLKKNSKDIDRLLAHIEPELPKVGRLTGFTFVFTGGFAEGKKFWESAVEAQGGKCGSSVGKSTNYVVEGTDAGSKAQKAKDLGIELISVTELKKILNLP
jgi:DNA ligase (NAD+)